MFGQCSRLRPLLGGIFLALAALTLSACQSAEQKAQSHYQHGLELVSKGDLVKAGLEFRQALKLKADLVPAMFQLATVLEEQRQFQSALTTFRDVADRDPKHVEARVHLARLLLAANQLDDALKYADQAYALAPGDASVLAVKAGVALKLDNRFDAIKFGQAALSVEPDNLEALMVLAAERLSAKDPKGALEYLDKGVAKNDRNIVLQLFRITALQALGNDAGVEDVFKRLRSYYPEDQGVRDGLVRWYVSKGRKDDAEQVLRDFATDNPKDTQATLAVVDFVRQVKGSKAARAELQARIDAGGDVFLFRQALAQLAYADGDYDQAKGLLDKLIADTKDTANKSAAQVILARMMIAQKDWSGAGQLADAVLADDAKNVGALSVRAAVRVESGKFDDAIDDLRQALDQSPQATAVLLQLADAYERSSKMELADEQYAKALRTEPTNPGVALPYVQFLLRYGRAEQAERVLTDLRTSVPNNAQVLTLLAQLKLNRQDWIGAQEIADALKKLNDSADQQTANQILAASLSGQKKYDESIKLLQESTASAPDTQSSPMAALVRAYVLAGKADAALQFLQAVLHDNPKNQTAQVLLGSLYVFNKQPDKAEGAYRAAIDADPTAPVGYLALAQFLASTGKFADAEGVVREGLTHQPDNPSVELLLAALLEREGKVDEAIAIYDKMFAANPRSTIAANNLASLLSQYHSDQQSLDRAFEIASRFRNSDIPQFQDTLGWIYYLRGDYGQALTLLKSSADRLSGLAPVEYHLGMAYKALGQTDLAVASLQKALAAAKSQNFPQRDEAQTALNELASAETPANGAN